MKSQLLLAQEKKLGVKVSCAIRRPPPPLPAGTREVRRLTCLESGTDGRLWPVCGIEGAS